MLLKAALPGVTYTGVSGDIAFDEQGDAIEHHRDGVHAAVLRQRFEKGVDGKVDMIHPPLVGQDQDVLLNRQLFFGRNQVDMVGLHLYAVLRHNDGHRRALGQELVHDALVIRRQMLDYHICRPGIVGHLLEQILQGLQPAG